MSNPVVDRVTNLLTAFDARVQAAPTDAWGNAAPCDGWTARDVVVHVANNLGRLTAALAGGAPVEIGADDDIVATWNGIRDGFLGTLPTADLSTAVPGPMGPMPAEQVLGRLVAMDVLVHTWDLARAVGGDEQLDADAVTQSYSGLKPLDAMIRQPGLFGPKVECAADADEQTQFLSFVGRRV